MSVYLEYNLCGISYILYFRSKDLDCDYMEMFQNVKISDSFCSPGDCYQGEILFIGKYLFLSLSRCRAEVVAYISRHITFFKVSSQDKQGLGWKGASAVFDGTHT